MTATAAMPPELRDATEQQPAARAALAAALAAPVHAYLLAGPPGSGKRRAARAPTMPGGARSPTPRHIRTSCGSRPRGPSTSSTRSGPG
jgi:hypothetical protein